MNKRFLGIGMGASRIKMVSLGPFSKVTEVLLRDHLGDTRGVLEGMLNSIPLENVAGIAVTGREGAEFVDGRKVAESEAVEEAIKIIGLQPDVVVSLGGESFVVYPIDADGMVLDHLSGNRCAAGTVEFFKQQLGRMGLAVEDSAEIARKGKLVSLAKRCSVHCKSDCTHALNKKKCSVEDIVFTLCHNMAEKVVGLIKSAGIDGDSMVVIGGAAENPMIIERIRELLPAFEVIVPEEASYFEAFGAASISRERSLAVPREWAGIIGDATSSFDYLPALSDFTGRVRELPSERGELRPDAEYVLGVDGGSTTTKVALVDIDTEKICAAHYTKTNGNPEKALNKCLADVASTMSVEPRIVAIGTTGSSGEILSLLCETPWYHNEIIAHAFGASHFDPKVDTIFEIGGQDSKFTSLREKVAVDFNMNESCSAGTGSFIEETAKDDLGVAMEQISGLALAAARPPRFSDQCAAFANSDTRKAFQEGASREDNLAGLVYAIAENYVSKVVGRRKIGEHIFFQGGTSKNRAIACALAARSGKQITVPPDSELMGAFGIALWLRGKIVAGEVEKGSYSLQRMLQTDSSEEGSFTCKACENYCEIKNLIVNGKKHPFGGNCSKWENARKKIKTDADAFDLVARRNKMLFHEFGVAPDAGSNGQRPSIGMQGIFSVYMYYPLYSWFFDQLGYAIKFSENVDAVGVQRCQSARCYPYEIAHGTFYDLVVNRCVKDIFVPHLVGMPRDNGNKVSVACPIAQAAPYYLSSAFSELGAKVHAPVLDMTEGLESVEEVFVQLGTALGHGADRSRFAFRRGCEMQSAYWQAARTEGAQALDALVREGRTGIVLVGRPYNAYSRVANMGVPRKFASSCVVIIPCDFIPYDDEHCESTMYWKYGQVILKALSFTEKHPSLFAAYISNFGCGPDSFIQHSANDIMGRKPYLYLELDSHEADAGVMTRVTAFLDIVSGYRRLGEDKGAEESFVPAQLAESNGSPIIKTSCGELVELSDPRVTLAFPSMGRFNTQAMAAAGRCAGFNAIALPPADDRVLAIGKEFTSGKECSPAILTVGSLVNYWRSEFKKRREDEILLFFMPTANGPCRFGQYNVYMRKLISSMRMDDVLIFSPTAEDGYRGVGPKFMLAGWLGLVMSSIMQDVRSAITVMAVDRADAEKRFEEEWARTMRGLTKGFMPGLRALKRAGSELRRIRRKPEAGKVPKVLLAGEIFVRSDELSCRNIDDYYAAEGIMLKRADVTEWVYFMNWHFLKRLAAGDAETRFLRWSYCLRQLGRALFKRDRQSWNFVAGRLKLAFEQGVERYVRHIVSKSGLLLTKQHDIDHVVSNGMHFINPALCGEAILTVGAAKQVMEHSSCEKYCGVVFIGPFNCMPNGVAESVMKPYAREAGIPYLTFETDGGPLPSNFRSQMEVHVLRAKRYSQNGSLSRGAELAKG